MKTSHELTGSGTGGAPSKPYPVALLVTKVKADFLELCDAHKAYLVKRAFRTFNEPVKTRHHTLGLITETSIKVLDASGIRPGRHLCRLLGDALLEVSGFHTVLLPNNFIADGAACDILGCIGMNQAVTVRYIDLGENQLTGEEVGEAVAQLLRSAISVESLRLANNPLVDAAVVALAEGLKSNCVLQTLDLTGTAFGVDGSEALAKALKANNSLQRLILSKTKIGTPGCIAIGRGLKHNVGLRELDLSCNTLDDRGATALADALESNRILRKLDLGATHLTDAGAASLLDMFKRNGTMQSINVMGCVHLDTSWQKLLSYATSTKQLPGASPTPSENGISARR